MKSTRNLLLLAAMAVLLPSCATPRPRFTKIRIGMTGAELVSVVGAPHDVRASRKTKDGRKEEVWEYVFGPESAKTASDVTTGVLTARFTFFDDPTEDRRVVFHLIDDRLARWGPKESEPASGHSRRR